MANHSAPYEKSNIIVTGGNGFIGANLSRFLVNRQANLFSFVRKNANLWRLQEIEKDINIVEIDLSQPSEVNRAIQAIKPTYLFHLAIPPHAELVDEASLSQQVDISRRNLNNLANAISGKSYFKCMIHACSSAIYQWAPDTFTLSESTPPAPTTLRGRLKYEERNTCLQFINKRKIPIKMARIFRTYGPWESDQKLIGKALNAARTGQEIGLGKATYKRDYIYIDDLSEGMLALAKHGNSKIREVNFGAGKDYSPQEIVSCMEELLGMDIPKTYGTYEKNDFDQGRYVADRRLARETLNWEPKYSLKEGLQSTINWHQNHYQWK